VKKYSPTTQKWSSFVLVSPLDIVYSLTVSGSKLHVLDSSNYGSAIQNEEPIPPTTITARSAFQTSRFIASPPPDYASSREIPCFCILAIRVVRGMPRLAAAPNGPPTTQLVDSSAFKR
jgi:hypothetical protein